MEPKWYHSQDASGEYYIVFADANNSSSKRRFRAADGVFIDQERGGAGSNFALKFRSEIRELKPLGALNKRPNLADAVSKGRLPDDVLGELRRLKRSIVG